MNYYVYQLRASDESLPFYIGKSTVGNKRLVEHLSNARTGSKRMTHRKFGRYSQGAPKFLKKFCFGSIRNKKRLTEK